MKLFTLVSIFILGCTYNSSSKTSKTINQTKSENVAFDTSIKTIHILVALCDNKYQGIVPVPAKIGNGADKDNNLYWGCSFGIRSYFKASKDWVIVKTYKKDSIILERLVFKHKTQNYYLIADAYKGKEIKQCTIDFLNSSCGTLKDTITVNGKIIGINGNASLLSYIGHDGLMDFDLEESFENVDGKKRDVIILACYSKNYFSPFIKNASANPLVWTTGLMCPEAYTIHDAIHTYIQNKSAKEIQTAAALAYAKYQKCSFKAANNLLVSGW
jgi:hypothetical protein